MTEPPAVRTGCPLDSVADAEARELDHVAVMCLREMAEVAAVVAPAGDPGGAGAVQKDQRRRVGVTRLVVAQGALVGRQFPFGRIEGDIHANRLERVLICCHGCA